MNKVLLFERDREKAAQLQDLLREQGFSVVLARSTKQVEKALGGGEVNLAVLDSDTLSGETSFNNELLKRFCSNPETRVVSIIGSDDGTPPVDLPGDDFVMRPYSPREVLIRLSTPADSGNDQQLEQLNVLYRIQNVPYETTKITGICQELARILSQVFQPGSVALHLKGEEDKPQPVCVLGEIDREDLDNLSRFVTRVAMVQKNILIFSDLSREGFWTGSTWNHPQSLKNVMCIPLEADGRVFGTVELYNVPGGLLAQQQGPQVEFLSQVIREMEKVLGFCAAHEKQKNDLQFAVDELSLLYDISNALTSTLDLDEMLRFIVKNALKSFKAKVVSLMLLERSKQELSIRFAEGLTEEIIRDARVKIGEGVAGRVAASGEPLLLVDMMGIDSVDIQKDIKSALSVPLKIRDEVIGVLNVSKTSRYQFTETDLKLLFNMGSLAAQAIEKASLYEDIKDSLEELKSSYMNTVKALSKAIEAKDPYTQGHVDRVAKYGLSIAMQLNPDLVKDEFFRYALILHDIGKIEIPDTILNKRGALDEEEMAIMRRHPEAGAKIIKPVKFLREVADMVRYHQERFDGKGYPKGLKGEEIPLIARIISVADAFDAITSDRPYRKARPIDEARTEIKKHAGTQFDPVVVQALCQAMEKKIIP